MKVGETILGILHSPLVLLRAPFLVPILLGKNANSVAWMVF